MSARLARETFRKTGGDRSERAHSWAELNTPHQDEFDAKQKEIEGVVNPIMSGPQNTLLPKSARGQVEQSVFAESCDQPLQKVQSKATATRKQNPPSSLFTVKRVGNCAG